jgi:plasmid stabilization system protein ParE
MPPSLVTFHPAAAREYQQARRWYAVRSLTAASGFVAAVREAVERIADRPAEWGGWRPPFRFLRAGRFPFVLYYCPAGPARVLVVAVTHERRREGYWQRRFGAAG